MCAVQQGRKDPLYQGISVIHKRSKKKKIVIGALKCYMARATDELARLPSNGFLHIVRPILG